MRGSAPSSGTGPAIFDYEITQVNRQFRSPVRSRPHMHV